MGVPFLILLSVLSAQSAQSVPSASAAPEESGRLVILNKAADTAQILQLPDGNVLATLDTGAGPHEVAVAPDGKWAVVSNYGREEAGSSLSLLNLEKLEKGPVIDLGAKLRPHGLAFSPDGKSVYVTGETQAQLWKLSFPHGTVEARMDTRAKVSHMVALGKERAYVANIGSGSITPVDLAAGKALDPVPTGGGAEGIGVAPDGRVWVTNREADTVSVVDGGKLQVEKSFDCPGFPIRVVFSPDGALAFVSCPQAGAVALFDARALAPLKRIKIALPAADAGDGRLFGSQFGDSPVPIGMAAAPHGCLYVALAGADRVAVLDWKARSVLRFLPTGREPDGIAWIPAPAGRD
ncbi:MAG: hypothetical protein EYC70_11385 [Planctomycetota bacterium]|nr:MAG: hypothetical protein EYC70_11385 [Planctomycetota bacterium]